MKTTIYRYGWGNNSKRETMKARLCVVLARGKMNSCLVEFVDNGQREIISRNALRKKVGKQKKGLTVNYSKIIKNKLNRNKG